VSWLLILCMLQPPPPDAAIRAADIEFTIAVEQWVAEGDPWIDLRPLPRVFELLGSEKILVRRLASRWIRLGGTRYLEPLVRATHNRDCEIRERARGLMSFWFVCPECRGSGICQRKREDHSKCPCDQWQHCVTCQGGGNLLWEAWNTYNEWDARTGITTRIDEYRRRKPWPKPTPTVAAKTE